MIFSFKNFLIEVDGPPPPMGGDMGGPPGMPMGGGMGGPPGMPMPMGGGMGGPPGMPMGGPMGGPPGMPGGGEQPKPHIIKGADVWSVLDSLSRGKKPKDDTEKDKSQSRNDKPNDVQSEVPERMPTHLHGAPR